MTPTVGGAPFHQISLGRPHVLGERHRPENAAFAGSIVPKPMPQYDYDGGRGGVRLRSVQ